MSLGRVLLAVGLFLDVAGTLFISWDVRKGQDATKTSLSILQYLIKLGNNDFANDQQILNTEMTILWTRMLDPKGVNQQLTDMRTHLEKQLQAWQIFRAAEPRARENTDAQVDRISNELVGRRQLIYAAIGLVFIGGILEFIAGVVLGV